MRTAIYPITGTPAEAVFKKTGGPKPIAQALGVRLSTVYRWGYPTPKGTGGIVPQRHWGDLLRISNEMGWGVVSTDFMPTEMMAAE